MRCGRMDRLTVQHRQTPVEMEQGFDSRPRFHPDCWFRVASLPCKEALDNRSTPNGVGRGGDVG